MAKRAKGKKRDNKTAHPIKASPKSSSGSDIKSEENSPARNIVAEFDEYFGNESKLENWQRLCRDVGIEDELRSITKCRKALRDVWVNIYDLLDAQEANKTTPVSLPTLPRRFPSERALAKYTIKEKKIYPKREAKKRGAVRALLARIYR